MAELAYDTVAEARLLEAADFDSGQAEAIVSSVNRAMACNQKMAEDLASIKARLGADLVTKDDIRDMLVKDDIRDMLVKDDIRDMVVKDDIRDMATRDCLTEIMAEFRAEARANFATKTEIAEFRVDMTDGFLRMYRSFAMGVLGICGLILGLVPIILLK